MLPRDHYLKQAFQDLVHFPNGFEKGGLSDIQARLVRKNGTLIVALCNDEVSDPTSDDLHILKVIANQSAPKNPVEQAWIKYLSITKTQDANSPTKSKTGKAKKSPEAVEPEKTTPAEAKINKPQPAETSKTSTKEKPAGKQKTSEPAAPLKAKEKAAAKEKPSDKTKAADKAKVADKPAAKAKPAAVAKEKVTAAKPTPKAKEAPAKAAAKPVAKAETKKTKVKA